MVSKKLFGVYVALEFLLLTAGVVSLVLSLVWRAENPVMNLVLPPKYLTAGTILGISLLATFVISVCAIVQKNHVTVGFVILNYALLMDAIGIIIIGTFIWFFTLKELANFHVRWLATSPDIRIELQDALKCCGYFNGTDAVEIGGSFCQSQEFVQNLQVNQSSNFCVAPITSLGDGTLNNIFTWHCEIYIFATLKVAKHDFEQIYGFMAIVVCLFLASLCVIKRRQEEERFKRIDAKRGRAFV